MQIRALVACVLVLLAGAAAAPMAFAQTEACPRPGSKWTEIETNVWRTLCAAEVADLTPPYGRMEPPIDGKLPENAISGEFLRMILSEPPYRDAVAAIRLVGVMVVGVLDLTGREVTRSDVTFAESHLLDGAILDGVRAAGAWMFLQDYFPSGLRAQGARFSGSLSFERSVVDGPLDLNNVTVGGDLRLAGSRFSVLVARSLHVAGSLDMNGTATTDVIMPSSTIGGDAKLLLEGDGLRVVHLTGTGVRGELLIAPQTPWRGDGRLVLTNVTAGTLTVRGRWPAQTEVADLAAGRIDTATATEVLDHWIRSPGTSAASYRQMAQAIAAGGNSALATNVRRIGLERERSQATFSRRVWLTGLQWTTGYGLDAQGYLRAILWAGALVALGWLVLVASGDGRRAGLGLGFSAGALLPAPLPRYRGVQFSSATNMYFWAQRALALILLVLVIAALAGAAG